MVDQWISAVECGLVWVDFEGFFGAVLLFNFAEKWPRAELEDHFDRTGFSVFCRPTQEPQFCCKTPFDFLKSAQKPPSYGHFCNLGPH